MRIENLGNGVILELMEIPEGTFRMGSELMKCLDEKPQHEVIIPTFEMGKYLVTQTQYELVMGDNLSWFKGKDRPVENVSWNEAVEFCQKLSQRSGKIYRLPTEAEWEYACRARTTTPYHFGDSLSKDQANFSSASTTNVGSFSANEFGLYDMHGNVWEWCLDRWHNDYRGAPTDGSAWTTKGDPNRRVTRGGCWGSDPWNCRSACRSFNHRAYRFTYIGFRVVCEAEEV